MLNDPPITQDNGDAKPEHLTPDQAAAWLGISVRTLWRWIASGILTASQPNPRRGGRRWIAKADLLRILGHNKNERAGT